MGGFVDSPEELLLRNALGGTLAPRSLATVFQPGKAARLLPELRRQIGCALGRLSFRERSILEMRFGLGDGYAYTLAQTGFVFRLTRERIRQIQAKALRKFRLRSDELQRFLQQAAKGGW